jgi:hypothetical protein
VEPTQEALVEHTATHSHHSSGTRTGEAQAIRSLRAWGAGPTRSKPAGLIRTTFTLGRPVAAVTVWAQSSDGCDVLTYRHATTRRPSRDWDVTLPDLPAGTYDVLVDVTDPQLGTHTSLTARVTV